MPSPLRPQVHPWSSLAGIRRGLASPAPAQQGDDWQDCGFPLRWDPAGVQLKKSQYKVEQRDKERELYKELCKVIKATALFFLYSYIFNMEICTLLSQSRGYSKASWSSVHISCLTRMIWKDVESVLDSQNTINTNISTAWHTQDRCPESKLTAFVLSTKHCCSSLPAAMDPNRKDLTSWPIKARRGF